METHKALVRIVLLAAAVLLLVTGSAAGSPAAQDPETASPASPLASSISYQGRLTDAGGNPLNGNYNLVFQVWNDATAGIKLGTDCVRNNVPVNNGRFAIEVDVPHDAFDGQNLWLRIQVNGQWLSPRQKLLPTPYALSLRPGAIISSPGPDTMHVYNESGGWAVEAWSANNIAVVATNGPAGSSSPPAGMHGVHAKAQGVGVWAEGGHMGLYAAGTDFAIKSESTNGAGLDASSQSGDAVAGHSTNGAGLKGRSENNDGVVGWTGAGDKSGVFGHSQSGVGVAGMSGGDSGVSAVTSSSNADHVALRARNAGPGPAIYAEGGSNGVAAILAGNVQVRSLSSGTTLIELGEGLDLAEGFDVTAGQRIEPGTVLVIDAKNPGRLAVSTEAYDRKVAGIVAGAEGLGSAVRLGAGQFDHDVALAGRVYCQVDATHGAVAPGDLLTTSPTPGYAMVAQDSVRAQGAILGKAMESLPADQKGLILVLVSLQ
jgi:hypothetical protein